MTFTGILYVYWALNIKSLVPKKCEEKQIISTMGKTYKYTEKS